MKDYTNIYFPIKLWITSIFFSILIFGTATTVKTKTFDDDFLGFAVFMFFYSIIYSFPTFLTILFIAKFGLKEVNKKNKYLLAGISIVLMLITIYISFGAGKYNVKENFSALTFSILSVVSILISTAILKTKKVSE